MRKRLLHIFFHPDYTVGPGIAPDLLTLRLQALAGLTLASFTAGGELHPAPKTYGYADRMTSVGSLADVKRSRGVIKLFCTEQSFKEGQTK